MAKFEFCLANRTEPESFVADLSNHSTGFDGVIAPKDALTGDLLSEIGVRCIVRLKTFQ